MHAILNKYNNKKNVAKVIGFYYLIVLYEVKRGKLVGNKIP